MPIEPFGGSPTLKRPRYVPCFHNGFHDIIVTGNRNIAREPVPTCSPDEHKLNLMQTDKHIPDSNTPGSLGKEFMTWPTVQRHTGGFQDDERHARLMTP